MKIQGLEDVSFSDFSHRVTQIVSYTRKLAYKKKHFWLYRYESKLQNYFVYTNNSPCDVNEWTE